MLAFATRPVGADEEPDLERLERLTFAGLQAMIDPPRPRRSRPCGLQRAGVAVKMITGDHPATAVAIAARDRAHRTAAARGEFTGAELAACPEELGAAGGGDHGLCARGAGAEAAAGAGAAGAAATSSP